MNRIDFVLAAVIIFGFFIIVLCIGWSFKSEMAIKEQYMNNLNIVINCRKSYGLNNSAADRICGPVPQWATYDRRNNQ
jgi:hypothetical protein